MAHVIVHHTAITGFIVTLFSEIRKYELSAGNGSFSKSDHFLQQCVANFLFGNVLAAHEFLQFFNVLITVKGETVSFTPIAACTTVFLVIAFYTFWNIVV